MMEPVEARWVYVLWKNTEEVLAKEFTSPRAAFNTLKGAFRVVGSKRTHCNERQWVFQVWR